MIAKVSTETVVNYWKINTTLYFQSLKRHNQNYSLQLRPFFTQNVNHSFSCAIKTQTQYYSFIIHQFCKILYFWLDLNISYIIR